MSISITDIQRGDFADDRGCRSRDPWCANAPPPVDSYEAYNGGLCSECADYEAERQDADDPE